MHDKKTKPVIGIFRHTLLPSSETFIAEQAAHISNFEVHFFGRERGAGAFDLANCHLIQRDSKNSFLKKALYTLSGRNKNLLQRMNSAGPLLLHAHFGIEGVYALPFAQQLKIPLLTTFHGFDATQSITGLLKNRKISHLRYVAGLKRLRQGGDCFIAVSNYIRRQLIKRGFTEGKIIVHHLGIDTNRFKPEIIEDDGQTILTVGRLAEKKGTMFLIKAIMQVRKEFPKVRLEIIGDGPLRSSLEQLVKKLKLTQSVIFRGSCTHDEVVGSMKKAAVFSLPSVTGKDGNSEGLPSVFLEAAAAMKPVVGTYHSGIPEAVYDGKTGFLVPEKDINALADRLTTLLKNPLLRREMGETGRKKVEVDFDISKQTKRLEDIYMDLIQAYRNGSTN